jgi:nucleoside-diphosphate-sugar epimerase
VKINFISNKSLLGIDLGMNQSLKFTMFKGKLSVAIIGCGWLGLPLAGKLVDSGMNVKGSTTNLSKVDLLKNMGIEPFLLKVPSETPPDPALFDVDFLVLNVPPGRRNPNVVKDFPSAISQIFDAVKLSGRIKKVIFISSTSVYNESIDQIDETSPTDPVTDSGKALLMAEKIVEDNCRNFVTLRFGGLAGPGRHPGKFLAGKSGLTSGEQSVNYLYLDDAIGVVEYFINSKTTREVYNVVAPLHPEKRQFYMLMSEMIGLTPPSFTLSANSFKREISVEKLLKNTGYKFRYPDPMAFKF